MNQRGPMIGWPFMASLVVGWAALWLVSPADPAQALTAYLAAWILSLGIPLGSLCLLMIHALTGGDWGLELRDDWIDAIRFLPFALALSLPLLCGAPWLFEWARSAHDGHVALRYLNLPFFYARCAVCFACWLILAHGARRRAARASWQGYAAGGSILMLLSVSIWAVDWIMSRVEGWHSTALGVTLFASQLLAALAFTTWRRLHAGSRACPTPVRHDMANLLLVAALGWGYLAFMDYLTAWISDLPADNVWYLPRLRSDWAWLGAALAMLATTGIVLLLSRVVKRSARALRWLAGIMVVMQAAYGVWLVLPDVHPAGLALSWRAPLAWLCAAIPAICAWVPHRSRTDSNDAHALDAST